MTVLDKFDVQWKNCAKIFDVFGELLMARLSNGYVYHEYHHTLNCIDFRIYKAFPLIWYLMSAVFDWSARLFDFCEIMLRPKIDEVSAISINHQSL